MATTDQVLEHLAQIEGVAEDILANKQQLINLDRKRQKTREASRLMSKEKNTTKHWVCFGDMFLKIPQKETKKILEKDFSELDQEISTLSKGLKTKVSKLRDLENKEDIKGFHLTPLSKEDMTAVEDWIS